MNAPKSGRPPVSQQHSHKLQKFKYRKVALAVADAFIIAISALISNYILSLLHAAIPPNHLGISIVMSMALCFLSLALAGAYNKLWRYFDKKDYLSCVIGVLIGILLSCIIAIITLGHVPYRYAALHCLTSILGISAFRFIFKTTFIDLTVAGRSESKYKRTMLIGAGQASKMLLGEIRNAQNSPYKEDKSTAVFNPVCLIDDDSSKLGKSIYDVQVVGSTNDIAKFLEELSIEQIVFCIPSCLEDERKRILDICTATNLPIKVIPFLGNLLFDDAHTTLLNQVRDIKVEALLGREPIKFDNADIRSFINNKVCILNELSEKYTVIIIDTPPVNVVTDAMELAKNISGIIMVVRYAVTTDEDLAAAHKKIEFAQMNLLGFILNGIKVKSHGGYYRKYKYGSKYY